MKKYFTVIAILLGIVALSTTHKTRPLPVSEIIIQREAYALAYDGQHRQARYVYEHLTPERVIGDVDRKKFIFKEDPLIPESLRAMLQDYYGSGFDRGHLCPAGDCKHSEEAMDESFFLTNISPQDPNFNRGY